MKLIKSSISERKDKSSSRSGRFKKQLVSEESLQIEAPLIVDKMQPHLKDFLEKRISPAEFCGIYIIHTLSHRYPGTWCGSKRSAVITSTNNLNYPIKSLLQDFEPNIQRRMNSFSTIGDLFNNFSFQSTPLAVQRSILEWSNGKYGLELMFRIPTPKEVLAQQKMGRRCVTVILDKEKAKKLILGERDALGFTMHDLIHADHFYHNNTSFMGQLGFYGLLDHCMDENLLDDLITNEKFLSEFEYLIADMNAYPIHLMKCFKSALIHYHPEKDEFFERFNRALNINQIGNESFTKLNGPHEDTSTHEILMKLLENYRSENLHFPK